MVDTLNGMLSRIRQRHTGYHVVDVDDAVVDKTVDVHRHLALVVDRLRDDNHGDPPPTGMGNSSDDSFGRALTTIATVVVEGGLCVHDRKGHREDYGDDDDHSDCGDDEDPNDDLPDTLDPRSGNSLDDGDDAGGDNIRQDAPLAADDDDGAVGGRIVAGDTDDHVQGEMRACCSRWQPSLFHSMNAHPSFCLPQHRGWDVLMALRNLLQLLISPFLAAGRLPFRWEHCHLHQLTASSSSPSSSDFQTETETETRRGRNRWVSTEHSNHPGRTLVAPVHISNGLDHAGRSCIDNHTCFLFHLFSTRRIHQDVLRLLRRLHGVGLGWGNVSSVETRKW